MSKTANINVCKRCGVVVDMNLQIFFTGISSGSYVNFVKCDDCKFSLRNLWRALTKKEEPKDE